LAPVKSIVEGIDMVYYRGDLEKNLNLISKDTDIVHIHYTPKKNMPYPFLVTINI